MKACSFGLWNQQQLCCFRFFSNFKFDFYLFKVFCLFWSFESNSERSVLTSFGQMMMMMMTTIAAEWSYKLKKSWQKAFDISKKWNHYEGRHQREKKSFRRGIRILDLLTNIILSCWLDSIWHVWQLLSCSSGAELVVVTPWDLSGSPECSCGSPNLPGVWTYIWVASPTNWIISNCNSAWHRYLKKLLTMALKCIIGWSFGSHCLLLTGKSLVQFLQPLNLFQKNLPL